MDMSIKYSCHKKVRILGTSWNKAGMLSFRPYLITLAQDSFRHQGNARKACSPVCPVYTTAAAQINWKQLEAIGREAKEYPHQHDL